MLGGRRFLLACAVSAATVLLFLGLFYLPFIRVSSLLLIGHGAQEHTIAGAAAALWRADQAILGGILLLLAVVLPVLRWLYVLALALLGRQLAGQDAPLRRVLIWWPQDLIALAAAAALIAEHEVLRQHTAAGAYCFGGAVIAMALAYSWRQGTPRGSAIASAPTLAKGGPLLATVVGLALLTFGLGLTQPVVRLDSAGTAGQSLVDLLLALQARGETVLWVPVAVLAVLLPGLRLTHLLALLAAGALPAIFGTRAVRLAELLGGHAILDWIVLGLGLFYLMETQATDRVLLPGVYCLAAAAVLSIIGSILAAPPAVANRRAETPRAGALSAASQRP